MDENSTKIRSLAQKFLKAAASTGAVVVASMAFVPQSAAGNPVKDDADVPCVEKTLVERVEQIRQEIIDSAGKTDEGQVRTMQFWGNFPNWPNWGNWNNWLNWPNF